MASAGMCYRFHADSRNLEVRISALYLCHTPDLDHEVRKGKTLNLYYGTCDNRSTGKDLLSAFDAAAKVASTSVTKSILFSLLILIL